MTSFDREADARKMCESILEKRLAACVKISPVSSSYWWKGRISKSREFLLSAVTTAKKSGKLTDFIKGVHPYEVPEVIVIGAKSANVSYGRWVEYETE
jgi:periplasmic divalent cation tolerance protein